MSLRTFHVVFIALSLVLSLMMCVWGFQGYSVQGGGGYLALGVTGVVFLGLLIPYIRWFRIKMSRISKMTPVFLMGALSGILAGIPSEALACPMCFADPTSLITKGMSGGILFLVLVVAGLYIGILSVIVSWVRRSRSSHPS